MVVVRLLLEKGATVNGCDKVLREDFFAWLTDEELLFAQGGHSPVFAASQNGHMDVVDLLVQAGADIHLATTEVYKCTVWFSLAVFTPPLSL